MIEPLTGNRYRLIEAGTNRVAYAVATGTEGWVFLEGRVYVIPWAGPGGARGSAAADDEVLLAAPMPATVLAVNIEPGQQVARGDVMIRLEAMKMELPITAPRDARVARVACRPGELVQPGIPLLELDP